ncbi:MAG: phosphoribosyltransferase [Halobacteriaceae archaeon]
MSSDYRRFQDRTDAGTQLGTAISDRDLDVDIVLAIPRGGLPLGRAVADALEVPLDIAVAKKIGAPGNPEYAIGAVASDGSVWRNEDAMANTRADEAYFERERRRTAEAAQAKADKYRGDRPAPDLAGKTVALVDDGVATGSTMRACIEMLRAEDADRIVVAIPVGPPDTVAALEAIADEVVCLSTPASFMGVGQFYDRFDQVSDADAMTYLDTG